MTGSARITGIHEMFGDVAFGYFGLCRSCDRQFYLGAALDPPAGFWKALASACGLLGPADRRMR